MSDPISLTPCSLDDLDDVTGLFNEYRSFYGQVSDRDSCRLFLSERLSRRESVIFLARKESKPVGFVQLYPAFSSIAMHRIWILNDLYVLESERSRGIGTELMRAVEAFARESNAVRLTLATGVENLTAQSLYKKLGWQQDDAYYHFLKPIEEITPESFDHV